MGAEFIVNTLEEMCDLMCGGIDPEEDEIVSTEEMVDSIYNSIYKMRVEIEQEYNKYRNMSEKWNERACGIGTALEIIDKYFPESVSK